jgi:hypothetical protein
MNFKNFINYSVTLCMSYLLFFRLFIKYCTFMVFNEVPTNEVIFISENYRISFHLVNANDDHSLCSAFLLYIIYIVTLSGEHK